MQLDVRVGRTDTGEPSRLLSEGPREAPEPTTAEERTLTQKHRLRAVVAGALTVLNLLAWHGVVYLPKVGVWMALLLMLGTFGLSLSRAVRRMGREADSGSPIRAIVLFWLAISVATVVLVSHDSFSAENLVILCVVWGVLCVLWLSDKGLARLLNAR